jgi:hypothetical protein
MKVSTLINKVKFYIIFIKILFLFNLTNINKLSIYFNNLINRIIIFIKKTLII